MTVSPRRSHGNATNSDLGVAVTAKIIQIEMAHRALHLIDVESRNSGRHHLGVLVLCRELLYTDVIESAVENYVAYLLELRARERLFHKV